jgi:hypothetical protein
MLAGQVGKKPGGGVMVLPIVSRRQRLKWDLGVEKEAELTEFDLMSSKLVQLVVCSVLSLHPLESWALPESVSER